MSATIRMFWDGGPIPLLAELSMRSFVAHGHDIELYAYGEHDRLPKGVRFRKASDILSAKEKGDILRHSAGKMANVSDLFRCRLLHEKGGYWADSDMICLKPWDFHERVEYMFAGSYHQPWSVRKGLSNSAMLAPVGSPLMKECASLAEKVLLEPHGYSAIPQLLERLVRSHGLWGSIEHSRAFCSVRWWQTHRFARKRHAFSIPKNAYGLHCYMFRWIQSMERAKGRGTTPVLDINRLYPEDTLIGSLQREYL